MSTSEQRQEVLAQKDRVTTNFRELIASTEALLKATATLTGSEVEEAREKLNVQMARAKEQASEMEGIAAQKYREAARATEEYVQQNVWKSIAIAGLVGVLFGVLSTSGDSRRDYE